jgi:hypothetical protein
MLRDARQGRRWTRSDLVHEFARTARRLGYRGLTVTERQIQRWESQDPPTPRPPQARILEAIFGQSLAELGWPRYSGLSETRDQAEWTPTSTIDSFLIKPKEDMDRRQFLLSGSALSAFAFRYYSSSLVPVGHSLPSGKNVGTHEIALLRDSIDDLRHLDARIGSKRIVEIGKAYCNDLFELLRTRSYSDSVGKQLFALAANITSFTGWLLFDAGNDREAQRFLRMALRAARHADDDIAASTVFAFMAIQKYNLCEWDDALMLATAARRLVSRFNCPHVVASLLTRQARALAGMGDIGGCYSLLEQSFEWYERGRGDDHPPYIDWVNPGELHGQAVGCAAILGDVKRADQELRLAKDHYGTSAFRSSSLHTLRLALGYAQVGEVEQACAVASIALDIGSQVRSYRFDEVKGDLAHVLRPYSSSRHVKELTEQHRHLVAVDLPRSALGSRTQ